MAVLPILLWPDARLSVVCDPVAAGADLSGLIADMFDTMYAAPGRGLAAPQVGVMQRVFVMDCTWKEGARSPMAFINPVVVARAEQMACADEGCLSIPGVLVPVTRPVWVELAWTTAEGDAEQRRFDGFSALCVQHEFDHLNGVVSLRHLGKAARLVAEAQYGEVGS
ncbi:MAG: peptide deformylase [Paracoccaceae bacterium]|jgi:peptide deformylase